jgi:hypothetical protein
MEKISFETILAKMEELVSFVRFANFEDVLKFQSDVNDPRSIVKSLQKIEKNGLIDWNMDYVILEDGSKVKTYLEALGKDEVWYEKKIKNSEGQDEMKPYLKEVSIDGTFTDKLPDDTKVKYLFRLKMVFTKGRGIEYYLSYQDPDSKQWDKATSIGGLQHLEKRLQSLAKREDFGETDPKEWVNLFKSPTNRKKVLDYLSDITSELKIPLDMDFKADFRPQASYRNFEYQVYPKSYDTLGKNDPTFKDERDKLLKFINQTSVKDSIIAFFAGVMKAEVGEKKVKVIDLRVNKSENPIGFRLLIQTEK